MGGQKFAVLLCAEDSEYVREIYGGYYGVFVRMLKEEGEEWDVFKVLKGELPEDDVVGDYEGFVITGSCNDAYGNEFWICRLLALVAKLDAMKKKVLGICFGHQILGRAVGGKIGRSNRGWDIGISKIELYPSNIFTSLKMPESLSIIECHRDEVRELPEKAEILGYSSKTGIEMFMYGDHLMGIQGHPEYDMDILLHLIQRIFNLGLIQESLAEDSRSKLANGEVVEAADIEAWKKLCTTFLKAQRIRPNEYVCTHTKGCDAYQQTPCIRIYIRIQAN
ncbi:gamma-glutamyl peptidase 5-like isoform X2 [Andrographis paniculata]|uniref:gamma-glutamyl peptidase 5-like isoform X2 n=1 Tax=Andrographis paniculata TaxID=175694 RepID=UPI0021E7BB1D|nr:gamma-glutamyl peptidase 5-like isoform X2 [Andrographis paniculata]